MTLTRLDQALRALASERRALVQRERQLIASLDQRLRALGYRVVAAGAAGARALRRARPAGRYRCQECGREFGHWLHLGRHRSTAHARRSGGKRVA